MTAFFCVYFSRFRVVLVHLFKPMCKPKNRYEHINCSSPLVNEVLKKNLLFYCKKGIFVKGDDFLENYLYYEPQTS